MAYYLGFFYASNPTWNRKNTYLSNPWMNKDTWILVPTSISINLPKHVKHIVLYKKVEFGSRENLDWHETIFRVHENPDGSGYQRFSYFPQTTEVLRVWNQTREMWKEQSELFERGDHIYYYMDALFQHHAIVFDVETAFLDGEREQILTIADFSNYPNPPNDTDTKAMQEEDGACADQHVKNTQKAFAVSKGSFFRIRQESTKKHKWQW